MNDFSSYMHAKDRVKAAEWQYNYSSQKLENEKIHERLAKIKSQHEPLGTLVGLDVSTPGYQEARDDLYAAAYYVVVGRMPG